MINLEPVSKVAAIASVAPVASLIQSLDSQANQLVQGQLYRAQVTSGLLSNLASTVSSHISGAFNAPTNAQLSKGKAEYVVKLEGEGLSKPILLKMQLDKGLAESGQSLPLRFLQSQPVPTFQLLANASALTTNATSISTAAQLISQVLSQTVHLSSNQPGQPAAGMRFDAMGVVTQSPHNPQAMAHDLAQSIRQSGLFYESHLEDLVKGKANLPALLQEPQNLPNATAHSQNASQASNHLTELVAQQLSVLENQRLSWQGEIWKGQQMRWDVHLPNQQDTPQHSAQTPPDLTLVNSQITLHLPHLGKVMANISLQDGRLRLGIQVDSAQSLQALKQQSPSLSQAFARSGQKLEALQVTQYPVTKNPVTQHVA